MNPHPQEPVPADAWVTDGVEGWTIDGSPDDPELLVDGTELLEAELPDPRLVDTEYLQWCYRSNPVGRAWERYHYVPDPTGPRLVAHYVNMPRRYRGPSGAHSDGAWSQHAVTQAGYQRARHFTRLGLEIYDEARIAGASFVVGVTNQQSTGPVVNYMGWRLAGPLPVRVVAALGRGRRRIEHAEVTDEWLSSSRFDDLASTIDRQPVSGWSTSWTPDVLRWRLACPHARYWVHVADDVAVVSTRSSFGPLRATVILKLFPLVTGGLPIDATRTIRTITRRHRSLFAVYAGFNESVRVRGVRPPRRLQPSPLNLIIRKLDPAVDQDALVLDTFEFLDMDAY